MDGQADMIFPILIISVQIMRIHKKAKVISLPKHHTIRDVWK
jgi:hypothetical protein